MWESSGAKRETKNGGWFHILPKGKDRSATKHTTKSKASTVDVKWWSPKMNRFYLRRCRRLTRSEARVIARARGLPLKVIRDLDIRMQLDGRAIVIAERNACGDITGLQRRNVDGSKLDKDSPLKPFVFGGKRGLSMDAGDWDGEGTLYITEGAWDRAAMLSLGYEYVIARPSASGGTEHIEELLRLANYSSVVIVADNDKDGTGQKGANELANTLCDHTEVRIITPPEGIKDACEWVGKHSGTQADVDQRRGQATVRRPDGLVVRRMSSYVTKKLVWLWPDRFPIGKYSIIAGDGGLGKSLITMYMAAIVTRGRRWPTDAKDVHRKPGGVVLLSAEDDPEDTIKPRLEFCGANLDRIDHVISVNTNTDKGPQERMLTLDRDIADLDKLIQTVKDCRLVIIDPISAYMGKADSHKDAEVRSVLAPLAALAAKHHVAVIAVMHLNKPKRDNGATPMSRIMGSAGFANAARAVVGVVQDKDDPNRRLMLPVKNNLTANHGTGLAYTVVVDSDKRARVEWLREEVDITTAEAFSTDAKKPLKRDNAKDWLRDLLKDGPVPAKQVERLAARDGHKPRTLSRAKKDLKIKPLKKGGFGKDQQSFWKLPK